MDGQHGQMDPFNNGSTQPGPVGQPSQGVFYAFANNRSTDALAPTQPSSLPQSRESQSSQNFQSYQYRVPLSVGDITNQALREQMIRTSKAATACQKGLTIFNGAYRKRYLALCPRVDPQLFHAHCVALARLFQWRDTYLGRNAQPPYNFPVPRLGMDESLAPPPKIPSFLVEDVIFDEHAYHTFYRSISNMREQYLASLSVQWKAAKSSTEEFMLQIPLTDISHNHRRWLHEWLRWRAQAARWENAVEDLKIATWEQITAEIRGLMEVAVENVREWDMQLSSVVETRETEYADLIPLQIPGWGR